MRRALGMLATLAGGLLLTTILTVAPAAAESANSLAVEARLAWNEAQAAADPVRKLRLLRQVAGNFQKILDSYRDSDRAVEVVADEKVAGLVPSHVRTSVTTLEARLPSCGSRPVRSCLLSLADKLIEESRAPGPRNRALFALARYQVAAGFPDRAAAALQRIAWDQDPPSGLPRLVAPLLEESRFDTALGLAEAVSAGESQDALFADIADDQAAKWHLGDAVETAQRIAAPARRATALSGVALRRAEGGDVEGAIRLFQSVYADDPNWMPAMTAVGQAKAGQINEALDMRTRIRDPFPMAWVTGHIATAYARQGRTEDAVAYFNRAEDLASSVSNPSRRIWLFQDLALAKQSAGFLEPAQQMLARAIQSFVPESLGPSRVALADGLVDAAERLSNPALLLGLGVVTAPDETHRVDALEALIQALINREDFAEALNLAEIALKTAAEEAPSAPAAQRRQLQATAAHLRARTGDIKTALANLSNLSGTAYADGILAAIAAARTASGQTEEALMTTIGISAPAAKALAYVEIMRALVRSGDSAAARSLRESP